jgi:hypothetical protein
VDGIGYESWGGLAFRTTRFRRLSDASTMRDTSAGSAFAPSGEAGARLAPVGANDVSSIPIERRRKVHPLALLRLVRLSGGLVRELLEQCRHGLECHRLGSDLVEPRQIARIVVANPGVLAVVPDQHPEG